MVTDYSHVEILLIEDNDADAELTMRAFRRQRLARLVHRAIDGPDGLDYLFARGAYGARDRRKTPQLILLDIRMPKMSGIEVLRQIKADEETRTIPVVMMTSSDEPGDIGACYRLGANSYVVKPIEFTDFILKAEEVGVYWSRTNQAPEQPGAAAAP